MSVAKGSKANTEDRESDETEVGRQRAQRVRRETLRSGLIATFVAKQSDACTHLSLPDVAKHWALLRRETTLKEAKKAALDDLMEAAFEGHIPELLFMDKRAGVEHIIGAPWCQDTDCPLHDTDREKELAARLDVKWFVDWRRFGDLELKDRHLKSQYGPHCWAPREAVVAFLLKRGVDRADLPISWFGKTGSDQTGTLLAITPPLREPKRLVGNQIAAEFERWRNIENKGKATPSFKEDFAHMRKFGVPRRIVTKLRGKYPRRGVGDKKPKTPSSNHPKS